MSSRPALPPGLPSGPDPHGRFGQLVLLPGEFVDQLVIDHFPGIGKDAAPVDDEVSIVELENPIPTIRAAGSGLMGNRKQANFPFLRLIHISEHQSRRFPSMAPGIGTGGNVVRTCYSGASLGGSAGDPNSQIRFGEGALAVTQARVTVGGVALRPAEIAAGLSESAGVTGLPHPCPLGDHLFPLSGNGTGTRQGYLPPAQSATSRAR